MTTPSGHSYFFHGKMTFTLLPPMNPRYSESAVIAAVVLLLLHVRATLQPPSWQVPAAGV